MVFAARAALDALEGVAGADVLAAGCGTGRGLVWCRDQGARSLTGLDQSPGMLAVARARLPGAALHAHDLRQPWPVPAGAFDLVLFCLTLEHIAELGPPLGSAARALRPGGRLLLLELHPILARRGLGAHFVRDGVEYTLPTVAHTVYGLRAAVADAGLRLTGQRDWRPRDLPRGAPPAAHKRGPDVPLLIELSAAR